jgi:acyl carrier protein
VRALAALVAAGRARAASPGLLDVAPVAGVAPYSASETLNALRSETPPGLPVAQAEMARPAAIEQDPAELVLRSLTETTGRSVALDDEVSEFDSLDLIELQEEVEQAFGLQIVAQGLPPLRTVGDLVDAVARMVAACASHRRG